MTQDSTQAAASSEAVTLDSAKVLASSEALKLAFDNAEVSQLLLRLLLSMDLSSGARQLRQLINKQGTQRHVSSDSLFDLHNSRKRFTVAFENSSTMCFIYTTVVLAQTRRLV